MNWEQVWALVLRYTFLLRRSVPRILEMFFWPMMDLLVWGFVTMYLIGANPAMPKLFTFLISAMIFWDILYRSAQGVTLSFLEDVWARNLLNIFVAPIRLREFLMATYLVGLLKTTVIVIVLTIMAIVLYQFNLFDLGFALIPFFANLLLMGWAVGMFTTGLILRWGPAAEGLAWGIPFFIQPAAAVFYPLEVLPRWLHPISLSIPATHVFEGMRQVLRGEGVSTEHLVMAFALNGVYLFGAGIFFRAMYRYARKNGLLAKLGSQ